MPLVGVVGVVADLLEPRLHGLGGDLLLVALALDHLGEQPFLAAFSSRFSSSCCSMRGELGFERFDGIPLGGEVAGDEKRRGDEVGLEAPLALLEVVRLRPDELAVLVLDLTDLARLRARLPAVGGDQVAVVLHGLGPVVHEVLIDVVGIEQRRGLEGGEQILGDGLDQRLGMAVLGEAREAAGRGLLPFREERSSPAC